MYTRKLRKGMAHLNVLDFSMACETQGASTLLHAHSLHSICSVHSCESFEKIMGFGRKWQNHIFHLCSDSEQTCEWDTFFQYCYMKFFMIEFFIMLYQNSLFFGISHVYCVCFAIAGFWWTWMIEWSSSLSMRMISSSILTLITSLDILSWHLSIDHTLP